MTTTWANSNEIKDPVTKAWGDERSNAIAMYDGIVTSNSTTGAEVLFTTAFASVDDYAVELDWQEDPGADGGRLYPEKAVGGVTICNSGTETGIKIYYRVKSVVGLEA